MSWDAARPGSESGTQWLSAPLRYVEATPDSRERPCTEHSFRSWDDSALFYRQWPALQAGRHAIILIHRGHEHSGRLQDLADRLALPDCAIFAWDARGHGRSPGGRGDAPSFGALVHDLDCFARHIADAHGIPVERIAVVASSLGAVIAGAWLHDYAPPLRALVLAAPAFRVKLYIPFAVSLLRLRSRLLGRSFLHSYVRGSWLTHDAAAARAYDEDPLVSPDISVDVLLGLQGAAARLVADAGAIRVPTLVLTAGADRVVRAAPQRRFVERLSSAVKEQIVYPGFRHSLFQERHRALQIELIARVLTNREGKPWLMRRRTQAEIDELAAAAGFVKQDMRVDEQGIFTVSLARRRSA